MSRTWTHVIAPLWKMLITCANHLKDLLGFVKFVHLYIRYRNLSMTFTCMICILLNISFLQVCCALQYIRKLLFSDLDKSSIEHILRQLRKLPWNECEPYILKCFMKVHKGKYSQVHLIASLTAGLSRYHDEFAVAVVDEVCSCPLVHLLFWPVQTPSLFYRILFFLGHVRTFPNENVEMDLW